MNQDRKRRWTHAGRPHCRVYSKLIIWWATKTFRSSTTISSISTRPNWTKCSHEGAYVWRHIIRITFRRWSDAYGGMEMSIVRPRRHRQIRIWIGRRISIGRASIVENWIFSTTLTAMIRWSSGFRVKRKRWKSTEGYRMLEIKGRARDDLSSQRDVKGNFAHGKVYRAVARAVTISRW